jgi:chromate transporter
VFAAFLRLGCTSFGGPVAHLGYFRAEFVARRAWLEEPAYADIVALCQFLPGPASSQVAVSLGMLRAGLAGGLAAWVGFTAPSAALMILFALGVGHAGRIAEAGWLHGLKLVAVAVVAQAVWGMARNLCPDPPRASLAVAAAVIAFALPSAAGQVAAIALAALAGWMMFRAKVAAPAASAAIVPMFATSRRLAVASLAMLPVLLIGLPLLADATGARWVMLADRFSRAGALVFGGGHVVLPLLQRAVVTPGWTDGGSFLAGYGAVQAVPGPLFSFAAYLGAVIPPGGVAGGLLCLVAIYLPSFLLLVGVLPFWDGLRRRAPVQAALRGVNAAVVGLLAAALYAPVWTGSVASAADFSVVLIAFLLLAGWRVPPWAVVALGAAAGAA